MTLTHLHVGMKRTFPFPPFPAPDTYTSSRVEREIITKLILSYIYCGSNRSLFAFKDMAAAESLARCMICFIHNNNYYKDNFIEEIKLYIN